MKELIEKYKLTPWQLSYLLKLELKYPIDIKSLAIGIDRLGDYQSYGWSFKKSAKIIAKINKLTGRCPAVIGNGLKSIYTTINSKGYLNEMPKFQVALINAILKIA